MLQAEGTVRAKLLGWVRDGVLSRPLEAGCLQQRGRSGEGEHEWPARRVGMAEGQRSGWDFT